MVLGWQRPGRVGSRRIPLFLWEFLFSEEYPLGEKLSGEILTDFTEKADKSEQLSEKIF